MMVDRTRIDPTLLEHQDPEARWWANLASQFLSHLLQRLEQRFGKDRHGVSPEEAVQSAVRVLLDPKAKDLCFESLDDMWGWLYTVAWRKIKDAVKGEHLDHRVPFDASCERTEALVTSGAEE